MRKVIIECLERIACDPCVDACPRKAIVKESISSIPEVISEKCTGCGNCVFACPGLAIFLLEDSKITIPYEQLPIPKIGEEVIALDREGRSLGKAEVVQIREKGKTYAITLRSPAAKDIRYFRVEQAESTTPPKF